MRSQILFISSLCVLSGCSWLNDWPPGGGSDDDRRAEITVKNANLQPPYNQGQEPAKQSWTSEEILQSNPGEGRQASAQQAASIAPAAGAAETSMDQRLKKLEDAVATLQTDYAQLKPNFLSLLASNERIEALLEEIQIQGVVNTAPAAGRPAASVPVSSPQPQRQARQVSTGAGSATVTGVRIGEHGSKTRLVLDVTGGTEFRYDLDNQERILLIDLPNAAWQGLQQASLSRSPFIAGWSYQPGVSGGSVLAVQLKKQARITAAESLRANHGKSPRIFLDITGS